MATLGAQTSIRGHFLQLVNTGVSLVLFTLLLCVGWIALSYLKSRPSIHTQRSVAEPILRNASVAPDETQAAPLAVLVYQVSGDNTYYHTSAHLVSPKPRTAMSEQAASKRGLKPCPICMRP
ncbi:MAG TPA: hypothetical protein VI756_16260 [Blastocatellia bacterium]